MPLAKIGPSLLACNLARLAEEVHSVLDAGADFLHVDVMDGHFVPNLSWGMPVIAALRQETKGLLDVHMMVTSPERWVQPMKEAGADLLTFHIEATDQPRDLIARIKACGMRCGIALKPGTEVERVLPFAASVDLVLVMTVEPGFGGQPFMQTMMSKVRTLRANFPELDIEVDGGLSPETIVEAAEAGANWIVAGSAVFKNVFAGRRETIGFMRRSVETAIHRAKL